MRAILFDLDGTLVDTERETAEALARALERGLGITIDQQDRDFIIGRSWVAIYDGLRSRYPALSWPRERLIEATAAAREEVFADSGITVLPGALATIDGFAHLGRALVTGSSRVEAEQALRALGRADAFDAIFTSEDVSTSKPSPEGYLAAAKALGVDPGECVVIEDSEAGIAAGLAAGAHVVAVRVANFHGQDQSRAHRILDDLESFTPELLEELAAR
ncbi:HAD family hydrolase [Haliangium ochraceum]|uniref:HAD-superfamily hydrolase, subfamily IA, variant 3 n=1 Tax=Haliangium ochraceum (strain DSM 14365 / JCM 11303 / SMP-2) TaxID=502025 RepID=D0LX51_HALO1|nr:HAD family phosphatase [Haliangium ochraceum]ACY16093.1 HAD-superfamily hydrolase, subfamily IA, variant 3 [Haliangium ochraceum DSM 14365]